MAALNPTPFPLEAARTGRYQAIEEWRQAGGNLDAPFRFEDWSPLQLLSAEGNRDGVRALLQCGAAADGRNPTSITGLPWQTPLIIAARYGHAEVVSILASYEADVTKLDSHGFSALHYAAVHGHVRTGETLLQLGAENTATPSGGQTPADLAQASGQRQMAQLLTRRAAVTTEQGHERLKAWLEDLDCSSYYSRFLDAGYDFDYIKDHGLAEDDIDQIGVPAKKLGLRKKLMAKFKFPEEAPEAAPAPPERRRGGAAEEDESDDEGTGESASEDSDTDEENTAAEDSDETSSAGDEESDED